MQMMCGAILLMAATLPYGLATVVTNRVTPVQKVIQLMDGMLATGQKEKHDEQVQFAAYRQFCDDTSVEKKRSIDEATEKMEMLKADIQKYTADATKLTKEIAELDEDVAIWTGDEKAATKVREMEEEDNHAKLEDLQESISAMERAMEELQKTAHDRKQADDEPESFVQLAALKNMALIPDEYKHYVDAFLQNDAQDDASDRQVTHNAPEANAYEFQSSGIIEMLSKLHGKFVAELDALEKTEKNSHNAYELLMQDLHSQIKEGEKDRESKAMHKAKSLGAKAEAAGSLKDTEKLHDEDSKFLADLTATCEQKASDFESRQQLRADEIEAIEKAIEIISSGAVAGSAEKHLPSLIQFGSTTSFGQLRANMQTQARVHVVQYLQRRSKQLNSRLLSVVSEHMENDPFSKVKKMLKELIVRLMEEANEEAQHKGWCDEELGTNEQTRREKSEAVETLHSEIDQLESSNAKLAEELTELSKSVGELDEAMAKATQMRQEEKSKNTETIEDAMQAQEAVEQAIRVLKDFYAKAGDATAFIQKREEPEIFDSPYKGMQSENGGVVGMMEVIESDFARLESETKGAEANGQKEYDSFMSDSKVDKAEKQQMMEHKEAKAQDQKQSLEEKRDDLIGTQKELDAALKYFDKLKPSCVDAGVSYEDRVARRKDEIQSLQEALKILNGEDIA